MFAPNDEVDQSTEHDQEEAGRDTTDSVAPIEDLEQGSEVGPPTFRNRSSFGSDRWISRDSFTINDPHGDLVKTQKINLISKCFAVY